MKKIDLLHLVEKNIGDYRLGTNDSLRRSCHMNNHVMEDREDIPQEVIDALLVDFLNYMGTWQGVNYGMYTRHLEEEPTV